MIETNILKKEWHLVTIEFEDGEEVEVKLSPSFWRGCPELRTAHIGKWMLKKGLAPWPKRDLPSLFLEPIDVRKFKLHIPSIMNE